MNVFANLDIAMELTSDNSSSSNKRWGGQKTFTLIPFIFNQQTLPPLYTKGTTSISATPLFSFQPKVMIVIRGHELIVDYFYVMLQGSFTVELTLDIHLGDTLGIPTIKVPVITPEPIGLPIPIISDFLNIQPKFGIDAEITAGTSKEITVSTYLAATKTITITGEYIPGSGFKGHKTGSSFKPQYIPPSVNGCSLGAEIALLPTFSLDFELGEIPVLAFSVAGGSYADVDVSVPSKNHDSCPCLSADQQTPNGRVDLTLGLKTTASLDIPILAFLHSHISVDLISEDLYDKPISVASECFVASNAATCGENLCTPLDPGPFYGSCYVSTGTQKIIEL
jgi:hypothetical protein